MNSGKKRRSRRRRPIEEVKPPVSHRLQGVRQKVWGAMGLASCVEYASDSMLTPRQGRPDFANTMILLYDHLGVISGDLEDIIDELGGAPT